MPAPLPPHPDNPNIPKLSRLSYLESPKVTEVPDSGGRPTDTNILQMEAEFSPLTGDGRWVIYQFPNLMEYDEWDEFRRSVRRILLKLDPQRFEELMDYLHNYKVVNVDLTTGEAWSVFPLPTGYVQIPQAS